MKNFSNYKIVFAALLILPGFSLSFAQSSGGVFSITQSVIATGGGQNSSGGVFSIDGTIGQHAAGNGLTGGTLTAFSGFWTPTIAPSAASVSVSGRILTANNNGIVNVSLMLTDPETGEVRYARSNTFGHYIFENLAVGKIYILTVSAKKFVFAQNTRVINLLDELTDADFVSEN